MYEQQVEDASLELEGLEEQMEGETDLLVPYRTALKKATKLVKDPYSVWNKVDVNEKHELFFFLFDERIVYSLKEGYRTAEIPRTARLFEEFVTTNSDSVDPRGFELLASSMPWKRSTK